FEVVTALAFLFFARRRPDLVILEVGLGGRLDATNVVTPLVSVITNISLEHTAVLGDTVEAIAREKAGIIKPGVPLLTAAQDPAALAVIAGVCREREAPLYRVLPPGEEPCREGAQGAAAFAPGRITPEGQYFSYCGFARRWEELFVPLRGRYQLSNAATALASLELLERHGFAVGEKALRRGLEKTFWPGRLERLREKPLLIMDGAHNPAGMKALAAALPDYFRYRRLVLVLGIMADKDYNAMLAAILPLADALVLTRPQIDRAADLETLAAAAGRCFNGPMLKEEDVGLALRKALDLAGEEDAVLVTGSLYTVSEARAAFLAGRASRRHGFPS
ncbi:MAG TPA: cyanophycin synthetase, partial [Bacillota bacterium]|nr:cyanophycin synthetase [Bacillota bacterium]